MTPWITVDTALTPDGKLVLQQRSEREFLITLNGRVLMNSAAHRSEATLGELPCRALTHARRPRVLLGGLGMAFTLRAALDALPATAEVTVAEINPVVVGWCRGPLAHLTARAVEDPRVSLRVVDFAVALRDEAQSPGGRLDAVIIDLYVGPDHDTRAEDPLYGALPCQHAFAALRPGGVFAVWAEALHVSFVKRLERAGFTVTPERQAVGRSRFILYVATKPHRA